MLVTWFLFCKEVDEVHADSAATPEQDQAINEVAQELAKLGDQYNRKFGEEMVS